MAQRARLAYQPLPRFDEREADDAFVEHRGNAVELHLAVVTRVRDDASVRRPRLRNQHDQHLVGGEPHQTHVSQQHAIDARRNHETELARALGEQL